MCVAVALSSFTEKEVGVVYSEPIPPQKEERPQCWNKLSLSVTGDHISPSPSQQTFTHIQMHDTGCYKRGCKPSAKKLWMLDASQGLQEGRKMHQASTQRQHPGQILTRIITSLSVHVHVSRDPCKMHVMKTSKEKFYFTTHMHDMHDACE